MSLLRVEVPMYLASFVLTLSLFAFLDERWFAWWLVLGGVLLYVVALVQAKRLR